MGHCWEELDQFRGQALLLDALGMVGTQKGCPCMQGQKRHRMLQQDGHVTAINLKKENDLSTPPGFGVI